jgi:hypothetical protein
MSHFRLLIDLATDRVIWYTDDLTAQLHTNEHSVQAEYLGDLPNGMSHANAWNYVYRNKVLTNTEVPANPPKSLLEINRTSINSFLVEKINEKRLQKYPRIEHREYIDSINFENATKFLKGEVYDVQCLYIIQVSNMFNSIEEAAKSVINRKQEKDAFLLSTELLLLEMTKKIKDATTNEELFQIRTSTFERLRTL